MVGIDIVTDPTIVQLELVLFLVRFSDVPLVQFLDELCPAYYHQAPYPGRLETIGQFSMFLLSKLTVPVIGKLTVVRRIEEHEIGWVVVLFEDRLETRVQYLGT